MSDNSESGHWTTVIRPTSRLLSLDLKRLLNYKFLMFLLCPAGLRFSIQADLARPPLAGSPAPPNNWNLQPCFRQPGEDPHRWNSATGLLHGGTTLWNYFSSCLLGTSTVFTMNSGLFSKVYFPRLAVPITTTITKLYTFGIQLVLFIIIYVAYVARGAAMAPNLFLLMMPLVMAHTALLGLGVGLWASALTVKYRDLGQLVSFGVSLWMWATPIVYPLSLVRQSTVF